MTSTGWTWDDCLDQLTISRLAALYKSWRMHPPAHKLIAAYIEYKPALLPGEATPGSTHMTGEMAEAIIRTGGVLISGDMLRG